MRAVRLLQRGVGVLVISLVVLSGCKSDKAVDPGTEKVRSTLIPSSNSGFVEARTSQITTDGSPPSQVFDDFTLAEAATISKVSWQGIYCVQTPGSAAPAPTATGFTVSIYPDAGGQPNTASPLKTYSFTTAAAGQTFLKNVSDLTCGTAANTQWGFYDYAATLTSSFSAAANTKYWLSIQATTPSYAVYFGWRDGTSDNNSSLQLFDGTYTTYDVDRAFGLEE